MADAPIVHIETNGYRNVIIRATLLSDGSGVTAYSIYDATSTGVFGVNEAGQVFYPGLHTTLVGLHYDIQDMRLRIQWDASSPQDILALGNAPEDFDWRSFGGIRVPSGLAGATGSIVVSTVDQQIDSTFTIILYIRKNVP